MENEGNFAASDSSQVAADDRGTGNDGVATTQPNADVDARAAVRAATVDLNIWQRFWLRRRLRFRAWRAKLTKAENWRLWLFWLALPFWLLWRKKYSEGFEEYFRKNASSFGEEIMESIPLRLRRRLEELTKGGGEPFLIVRGVFSRRFPPSFTKKLEDDRTDPSRKIIGETAKKLMDERYYNLIASALIAVTGAVLRHKLSSDPVFRDFITDIGAEKNQFADGNDMHLRYRTATPEKTPMASGNGEAAARIILFACVENPIADPIYLIRVDEVVSRLSDKHQSRLREARFFFFDNWAPDTIEHNKLSKMKRILYDGPSGSDPWLSFDPNRFAPKDDEGTTEHRSAVSALMAGIRQVAATSTRKIVLHRGDALIVDNYRALTRRHEHGHTYFDPRPFGRPPIRWLRVYYGFPKR